MSRTFALFTLVLVLFAFGSSCGDNHGAPIDASLIDAGVQDSGIDANVLPDLTLNRARAEIDLALGTRTFDDLACELHVDEACAGGPGLRSLLYFSVETPNIGTGDMLLGQPSADNEQFSYSECHEHFHFEGYATYALYDPNGDELATGRKQAFCLLDSNRFDREDETVSTSARFNCSFQGIQRGWSDVYHSRLPCQFIDVTDLAAGAYTLRVEINTGGTLEELDMSNNRIDIPIELGSAALTSPTEPCPTGVDEHTSATLNRECGWESSGTFACTPGNIVDIGCNQECGTFSLGECTGNPMMRVCDAARPDGNCSFPGALDESNDACQSSCPLTFDVRCPESGMVEVFVGPRLLGETFTCDLSIR